MPKLGDLVVYFKADIKNLRQGISVAAKEIQKLNKTLARGAAGNLTGEFLELKKQTDSIIASLSKVIPKNMQVSRSFKYLGDNMVRANIAIRESTRDTAKSTIKSLLSIRSFFAKVVHYITFSIGVQMVMSIRRGFEEMISSFKEFQRAATNAATVSGYLGSSFEEVRDRIMKVSRDLGRKTVFSALEVAQAFYNLASAGYDVARIGEKELLPVLNYAAATQATLEDAVYAVSTALKAFRLDFSKASEVVDIFTAAITSSFLTFDKLREMMKYSGATAGALGVDMAELVAAGSKLVDTGLEGSQAGQRLNMILTKLIKPTDKARKMLENLGVTMDDLNPQTHSFVDILYTLRAAGFGAAEASAMFRARTAASAMVLVDSVDAIAAYASYLKRSQGITESVAEYQERTLWGAFKKVTNAIQDAGLEIGNQLTPALLAFANFIRGSVIPSLYILGKAVNFIVKHGEIFIKLLKLLISFLLVYRVGLRIATKILMIYFTAQTAANRATAGSIATTIAATKATLGRAAAQEALNATLLASPWTWVALAIGTVITSLVLFGEGIKKTQLQILKFSDVGLKGFTEDLSKAEIALWEFSKIKIKPLTIPFINLEISEISADTATAFRKIIENLDMTEDELKELAKLLNIPWNKIYDERTGQLLIGWAYEFVKAFKRMNDEQKEAIKTDVAHTAIRRKMASEIAGYIAATIRLSQALEDEETAHKALEKISPANIEAFAKAHEDVAKAIEARRNAEQDMLTAGKALLTQIRKFIDVSAGEIGVLDDAIGYLEKEAELQAKISLRTQDLTRLKQQLTDATEELSNAVLVYGTNSKEAANALNSLYSISRNLAETQSELNDIEGELYTTRAMITKLEEEGLIKKIVNEEGKEVTVLRQMTDVERELYDLSKDYISLRETYLEASKEATIADAKLTALQNVLENATKTFTEKLKNYLDTQDKIYETEYKLYKLRQDQKKGLEDLFEKLAEQGLISQDIIDAYKELEISQGELLGLNYEFMNAYAQLTPEQQELVEAYMNGEASLEDLADAGIENLDIFQRYHDALERVNTAVSTFRDIVQPLVQNLVDMNVVSSDTAKTFFDLLSSVYDTAKEQENYSEAIEKSKDSIDDVLKLNIRLARALQDEADEVDSVASIYVDFIDKLKITDKMGDSASEILSTLNSLFGTNKSSLEDFTDSQLIMAATLVQLGSKLGLYEKGMSLSALATDLHAGSLERLDYTAKQTLRTESTMYDLTEDNTDATQDLKDAASELRDVVNLLTKALYGSNKAAFDFALKFDFADTLVNTFHGNVNELISFMNSQGWEWDINMMTHWDGKDWSAFYAGLTGPQKAAFAQFVQDVSGEKIDITTEWDGQKFADFLSSKKGEAKILLAGIEDVLGKGVTLPVKVKVSGEAKLRSVLRKIKLAKAKIPSILWPFVKLPAEGQRGGIVKSPEVALIGEAGPEAVVPLVGANRKFGKRILEYILPRYYPELMTKAQAGGIFGTTYTRNVTYTTGPTSVEEYHIHGPINVTGVSNVNDFVEQLKYRARVSR